MKNIKKIFNTYKLSNFLLYSSILILIIAFNFAHNPPSGWYQQFLPNIGGRQISDVFFLDSLTGWAITPYRQQQNDTAYILKTTNGGDNWLIQYSRTEKYVGFERIFFLNANTGFTCGTNDFFSGYTGLSKSTDGGMNWVSLNVPDPFVQFDDMSVLNEDTIWLAASSGFTGGVFRTTNGGMNWTQQVNLSGNNPTNIYFYNKDTGYTASTVLYKTTNGGGNWFLIPGGGFGDMHFINATTGWKSYGPIQKTTDGGLSWINQTLPQGGNIILSQIREFSNVNKDTIWGVGGHVFYTGIGNRGMIYRTTNGGENWLYQIPDTNIVINTYFFSDFINKKLGWSYHPFSGVHTITGGDSIFYPITNINQISSEIPKDFKLHQNYPNPFNPKTVISYQLASRSGLSVNSFITMKVYGVLGSEVKTLVNKKQNAGNYKIEFDAVGLPSGVYFYSLFINGAIAETKKMLLLK